MESLDLNTVFNFLTALLTAWAVREVRTLRKDEEARQERRPGRRVR